MGFNITLIGRKLAHSQEINNRPYSCKRMKLIFSKGSAFYLEYNIRLLFLLLFSKADIFLSNDLDTLLANYLASKLKNKPLVYDSHEYFTEVPELIERPHVQRIWEKLEGRIVPRLKHAYTVCESIASIYREQYLVDFKVVRNIPLRAEQTIIPDDFKLDFGSKKIILYQGALNLGRGIECAIEAMQYMENSQLVLAGDGDLANELKALAGKLNVSNQVCFLGRIPLEDMKYYTAQAHLGLSIEEDRGLNYRFALPNKLFDYIQQGVPVLVSDLPEMKRIVDQYQIGLVLGKHNPQLMAKQIQTAMFDLEQRVLWKINLKKAAQDLCWENEEKVLMDIFQPLK